MVANSIEADFPSFFVGNRQVDGGDLFRLLQQVADVQEGIVAHPGGGRESATLLVSNKISEVSTVGSVADSVMLPLGLPGASAALINDGANACQVFGYLYNPSTGTGDTIGADGNVAQAAAATGVSQASGTTGVYWCFALGKWKQMLSLGTGGGGGGGAVGPAGTVQMSLDGTGPFTTSRFADISTGTLTAKLYDAVPNIFAGKPGFAVEHIGGQVALGVAGDEPFLYTSGFGNGVSELKIFYTRGSVASPLPVLDGTRLGHGVEWFGYAGGGYLKAAGLEITARSDFSGTPTSSVSMANASGLGWTIGADGRFNAINANGGGFLSDETAAIVSLNGGHAILSSASTTSSISALNDGTVQAQSLAGFLELTAVGALNIGSPSGPAPSTGDINVAGAIKVNGVAIGGDTGEIGVVAAGTDQGTATLLTAVQSYVDTVAAGTGVRLYVGSAFGHKYVTNRGANDLLLYPATGVTIDTNLANDPVTVPVGRTTLLVGPDATAWRTVG